MNKKFMPALGPLARVENDPAKREEAIKKNLPIRFEIQSHSKRNDLTAFINDLYNQDHAGRKAVREHSDRILKYSERHSVDPDLVRSVMYAENARGHKIFLNKISDSLGKSESPLPMNIQKNRWASLIDKGPDDLYDPDANIEAATVLLRRITDRIRNPSPEKVGSIWHYLGREKTDEFGEYIGEIYRKKPWRKIE